MIAGIPEAAAELVSENVKEMNNPTRDGRAMIAAGWVHPGRQVNDRTDVTRSKRHHRRCSRLEPTGEFICRFTKLT